MRVKMKKVVKIHEKFLYEIWKTNEFGTVLHTNNGDEISVIDPGTENTELGGPDFTNARIRIGNITYNGDIEIDNSHFDWKAHGHDLNSRYNKVVLHVVVNGGTEDYVTTRDGRKVLSVSIGKFLSADMKASIKDAIITERNSRLGKVRCAELNAEVPDKQKLDYLYHLGIVRFKNKCARIFDRLKEITYMSEMNIKEPVIKYEFDQEFYNKKFTPADFGNENLWIQLLYELLFEALGYTNNKDIMNKIARSAGISFLRKYEAENDYQFIIEAALMKISGIIPNQISFEEEETAEYIRQLTSVWNRIKSNYDNIMFRKTQWHFDKQRPQNFPTIRLAGGARLVYRLTREDMMKQLIKTFSEKESGEIMRLVRNLLIVKAEGYWQRHYTFDKVVPVKSKFFIGFSRVDEIYINIILPLLAVYFEVFNNTESLGKVFQLYSRFRHNTDNSIVNQISSALVLNDAHKRSVLHQGMLELFRSYCSKELCLECKIGKQIYN
jgi:hypothetical protein